MRPSQRLLAWLDRQLASRKPGARLPTTQQLAHAWDLSPATIARLLDSYHKAGRIVRIPRRGTFVAPLEAPPAPAPADPVSSVQSIVDAVKRSITDGSLRRGDALPSVKFMSRQFRVAARTAIAAYRQLAAQTHVVRVGKTSWVGTFPALTKRRSGAAVCVFKGAPPDYRALFDSPEIGLAMRTMESELADHGCVVHYGVYKDCAAMLEQWRRDDRWPMGIVLGPMMVGDVEPLLPWLSAVRRPRSGVSTPVLALIDTADYRQMPRGVTMVSRGTLHTAMARTLVHYATRNRIRSATFFMDYDGHNLFEVFVPLKTRTELRSFDPAFPTRIVVTSRLRGVTRESFLDQFRGHTVPDYRKDAVLGKYRYTPVSEVESDIELVRGRLPPFHRVQHGLWVFNRDEHAAAALEWARRERLDIPGGISVVSFENSPQWYGEGISTCHLQWSNTGYLMAHALLSDVNYEKTGKGFMRLHATIVHRKTTRAG